MSDWLTIGRPGSISSRKAEVFANCDKLYGKDNWQLIWDVNGDALDLDGALNLYDKAYFEYFKSNRDELEFIANNYAEVFDNNPSNVSSGLDYSKQETDAYHFQDISVRRCVKEFGLDFKGKELLQIRTKGEGAKWSPGKMPFHQPELIMIPELKEWWNPGSIESFYQSNRYLEATSRPELKDIYLVNCNSTFEDLLVDFSIGKINLDLSEDNDSINRILEHKARVAYSVLCLPVICDYSGKRSSLDKKCCSIYGLSYFDETLGKPKMFISKAEKQECGLKDNSVAETCWKELAEYLSSIMPKKQQQVVEQECV